MDYDIHYTREILRKSLSEYPTSFSKEGLQLVMLKKELKGEFSQIMV